MKVEDINSTLTELKELAKDSNNKRVSFYFPKRENHLDILVDARDTKMKMLGSYGEMIEIKNPEKDATYIIQYNNFQDKPVDYSHFIITNSSTDAKNEKEYKLEHRVVNGELDYSKTHTKKNQKSDFKYGFTKEVDITKMNKEQLQKFSNTNAEISLEVLAYLSSISNKKLPELKTINNKANDTKGNKTKTITK